MAHLLYGHMCVHAEIYIYMLDTYRRNDKDTVINDTRYYLPNPSARAGYDTRSLFKQGLTGLNSEFSFS